MTRAEDGAPRTIEKIVAERAVRTEFQPVVHLGSREIVGFEAVSMGPVGSDLETPQALLHAAAEVGLVAELDWVRRAAATRAAMAADLHPSLSWFIDTESASLATPCPDDLLPLVSEARSELRVILQVSDRGLGERLPELLLVESQIRRNLWGIAIDDVGSNAASLALLPVIRPDVIKLDLSTVESVETSALPLVVDTINAYVEHSHAVLLAQGVDTVDQERVASVFGATFAQGKRFGDIGSLPDSVVPPRAVIPLRHQSETFAGRSPHEVVTEEIAPRQATRAELRHIGEFLQAEAQAPTQPGLMLANLREAREIDDETWERIEQIIDANVLTVVLANGVEHRSTPNAEIAPPDPTSTMAAEWSVIVLRSRYTAAFLARLRSGPDNDNAVFDFVVTHDPGLVATAARIFLSQMRPELATSWLAVEDDQIGSASDPTPTAVDDDKPVGLLRRAFRRAAS